MQKPAGQVFRSHAIEIAGASVLLATLMLPWVAAAGGGQPELLPVRIRVYGVSPASEQVMEAARVLAGAVLRDIGIAPQWTDCSSLAPPPACDRPPARDEFVVRIVRALPPKAEACGVSVRPPGALRGQLITIFADCVRQAAHRVRVAEPIVLAYTLLHELGHLLLTQGHSRAGIMRARLVPADWTRASLGTLGFMPQQATDLRAALGAGR
jgi:hypothetical protein